MENSLNIDFVRKLYSRYDAVYYNGEVESFHNDAVLIALVDELIAWGKKTNRDFSIARVENGVLIFNKEMMDNAKVLSYEEYIKLSNDISRIEVELDHCWLEFQKSVAGILKVNPKDNYQHVYIFDLECIEVMLVESKEIKKPIIKVDVRPFSVYEVDTDKLKHELDLVKSISTVAEKTIKKMVDLKDELENSHGRMSLQRLSYRIKQEEKKVQS